MSAASTGTVIEKASYTHAAMVDLIVANPMISQRDIAYYFGYTEGWVSQILRSDALREMIAAKKIESPLFAEAEQRFAALAHRSIDVLMEQLDLKGNPEVALKALDITSRSLGYGVKAPGVQINQQFVVAMPQKALDGVSWMADHRPQPALGAGGTARSITIDTVIDG